MNRRRPIAAAKRRLIEFESDDGFIIIAVLWILAVLASLVLIYSAYITNTAFAVAGSTDRVQSQGAIEAAVEMTAYRLLAAKKDPAGASGRFDARLGSARVLVVYRPEAARIDLNAAPKDLLAGLLVSIGASPMNADVFADRIIAWRTPVSAQNSDSDPENSYYRSLGLNYTPRHGPFPHIQELWLVTGIPPAFLERMLPYVTVFNGGPSVDIFDAAPQVVAALPGVSPQSLQTILAERSAGRTDTLQQLTGRTAATDAPKAVRASIQVAFDSGLRAAADVVIMLVDEGEDPYRILFWKDEFESRAGSPPR